jgi:hypothetical protein
MMATMKNYRLHFEPATSVESVRDCIVQILMLMHKAGAWPRILHPTGLSKKDALKKCYDLSLLEAVQLEVSRVVSARHWPNLPTKSYWSEEVHLGDRFVIRFSSNSRGFAWYNMMHIELPERLEQHFASAVSALRQNVDLEFIVMELARVTAEVFQVSTGDGTWYSATDGLSEYRRLIALVGPHKR